MPAAGRYSRLRLRRGVDFRAVYSSRRASRGRLLAVHWRTTELSHPRVGFSISKKVGDAVERNRLKRRLREVVRPLLVDLDRGLDVVVVVRPVASGSTFAQLNSEFRSLTASVLGL